MTEQEKLHEKEVQDVTESIKYAGYIVIMYLGFVTCSLFVYFAVN